MADILAAVQTARQSDSKKEESFLSEVSSHATHQEKATTKEHFVGKAPLQHASNKNAVVGEDSTPEQLLQILRSEPNLETLIRTLKQLDSTRGANFSLHTPGPLQAQIVNTIINSVIPTFWRDLSKTEKTLLIGSLANISGACALNTNLRLCCDSLNSSKGSPGQLQRLEQATEVVTSMFTGRDFVLRIWTGLALSVTDNVKRRLAWKEFIALVGSGKITANLAQAEDVLKTHQRSRSPLWQSRGADYAAWLGRNIASLLVRQTTSEDIPVRRSDAAGELLAKSFSLGYQVSLVSALLTFVIGQDEVVPQPEKYLATLGTTLSGHAKRQLIESTLTWLSTLSTAGNEEARLEEQRKSEVKAYAALIAQLVRDNTPMQQHLFALLSDHVFSTSISLLTRRACIISQTSLIPEETANLLERLTATFGDQLFINHAPLIQQECLAQTLLVTAGCLHRHSSMAALVTVRSSGHMQGVSNRLHSTNQRARWLGMVVGTALSSLVDKEGSRMTFDVEDMHTAEAAWYQALVNVEDGVGTMKDFERLLRLTEESIAKPKKKKQLYDSKDRLPMVGGKQVLGPPRPPVPMQTEVVGDKVAEVFDDNNEEEEVEDGGLKPYGKPDSDPEDSDEDSTLVNRNKPRAPVYIRDLMRMLKDDKDHDRFQMAIKHAATLIRRKADFGREVRDHAEELGLLFCGLQDPFETDHFDELRLQALIALLLSEVENMAPWLSKQAFVGDYSIAQRCIMLSALGLGGRELAGLTTEDGLNPSLLSDANSFPSKRLPPRLHAIYSRDDNAAKRIDTTSKNVERQLIKPLALSAADQSTSHLNALKVRTFSSRMDVERTKRKPAPNRLAKVFGQSFFFPLANRYQQEVAAYASGSVFVSAPVVLVTFLKTLALLFHASGPATVSLPEITAAFWDLVLSLKVQAIGDISILEAVLFSLLTILEINADSKERIVNENPKQLMETQQWTEVVFDKTGGGQLVTEGSDEETRVRTLAAGVLVKTREVIDAYQKMLIGHGLA